MYYWWISFPIQEGVFSFADSFLHYVKTCQFDVVPFVYVFLAWGDISKKILLRVMWKSLLPMFPSRSFILSGLAFKSLICFEFIFVCGLKKWSSLIYFTCLFNFPTQFIKETVFNPFYTLTSFVIDWPHKHEFISVSLVHLSTCLFLCQYHAVLITIAM